MQKTIEKDFMGDQKEQAASPVVAVKDYRVTFQRHGAEVYALRGVSLEVAESEIVALVGESGSGKSVLGLSMLGLLSHNSRPSVSGEMIIAGENISQLSASELRHLRRRSLGAVFQDPMTSLNPTMRIGKQLREVTNSTEESISLLQSVGVPQPERRLSAFPHELSGGLRQRVMIAMALAGNPRLIVADEPTTALDVTVQAQILELLRTARARFGTTVVLITHDLGVASVVCDRVLVMYGGEVLESGPTSVILNSPLHPYTKALLASRLTFDGEAGRSIATLRGEGVDTAVDIPGCVFSARCPVVMESCLSQKPLLSEASPKHQVACLRHQGLEGAAVPVVLRGALDDTTAGAALAEEESDPEREVLQETSKRRGTLIVNDLEVSFRVGSAGKRSVLRALRGVSLEVARGEALAIVGESGSGKSTLLRAIAGLSGHNDGSIQTEDGTSIQMVFQDSGASLTPWRTVNQLLEERLVACGIKGRQARSERIAEACDEVGLYPQLLTAKAYQLSGGQRQRAALARAVVVPPDILLCDEPTSALDVSLAAVVLNLISALRKKLGMTLLFVTHDLAVARVIADRIAVMYLGRIVEVGSAQQILSDPVHPYTQALISAVPSSSRVPILLKGEPASPLAVPTGCSFHPRCGSSRESCSDVEQFLRISPLSRGHLVACDVALGGE